MSDEERIYKQLENISSTIIKALEGLEKELEDYIQVTDSRFLKLEDKVNRLEALANASSRGLVKTIEDSTDKKEISELSHIVPKRSSSIPQPTTSHVSQVESLKEHSSQPKISTPVPIPTQSPIIAPVETPAFSKVPEVPIPPSFKPTLEKEPVKEEITVPQPKKSESSLPNNSIAEKLEEKKKEETDQDKDDLMSALKMIDSL